MRWDAFFDDHNVPELRWSALSDRESQARRSLQPFIELIERRAPVAALPRVRNSPDRVDWYVGWRSESDARFAADLLSAFLGPTYADLSAPLRPLQPVDAAEEAFAEEFGGRAFRIAVHSELRKEARGRLQALANCLLERPHRRAGKVRPVGRILRDLEFAMQERDNAGAAEEIRALRAGGHLDEVNLAFLDLRRLAAGNDWAGIFAHDALSSVLELRSVPWRVRKVLLEAVYHRDLAPLVAEGGVEQALKRVEEVLPDFGAAFSSRSKLSGLAVDVCFLLADEVRGQADLATAEGFLSRIAESGHVAFVDAFRAKLAVRMDPRHDAPAKAEVSAEGEAARPLSEIEFAQRALGDGDLDRAYALALEAPRSPQRVKVLLQCARLLDDESASAAALGAWGHLAQADQDALLGYGWCKTHLHYLEAVGAAPTGAQTVSWLGWFERLRSQAEWRGAVSRAEGGAGEWDIESVAGDSDAIATVVDVVEGTLESWAGEALRQALPYVLEAFLGDPPDPRLAPVFASLFDVLATDDALTLSSISALIRLGQARLSGSPSAYTSVLDAVTGAIEEADSPGTTRLVADAFELLIVTPCASRGARASAATRLASVAARGWGRVDGLDRDLVRQLCGELGVAELLPPVAEAALPGAPANAWAALAGRQIAFYSLETDALQRVVSMLRRACPEAKLKAFSELGGTESMREAARTADLFVIATRSATHAATGAVMQHRRAGKATEYAHSKSSTSLLDAVRRWLASETPSQ
jgi:ABC-type amino acid transport substrate-binding protein